MGWCGGTEIFDGVMDSAYDYMVHDNLMEFAEKLAQVLWDSDWDCEHDSKYFTQYLEPIMKKHGWLD